MTHTERPPSPLQDAVEYIKASLPPGEQNMTSVSHLLGISPQYLYRCLKVGETSAWTAVAIEKITKGKWHRDVLAPHLLRKVKQRANTRT